jgi:uncharacterized membrane protein
MNDRTSAVAPATANLLASVEGRILAVGLALAVLLLLGFGIGWFFAPQPTLVLAAMTGLNAMIGRAAGMSYGYANGLEHLPVVASSAAVETIYVLIVYPLFALSWQQLLDLPRLRPLLARIQVNAEAHHGWVRRFGIIGLFLFVFAPFWMTGPAAGAIIGYLIGLRARVNLAVVLSSTYLAIGVWALLIGHLSELTATFNQFALFGVIVAIALIALAWRLLANRRRG